MEDTLSEDAIGQMFRDLDVDHDGHLDLHEVMTGLKRLQMPCTEVDARAVMEVDAKQSHPTVAFDAFRRLVLNREQQLGRTFRELDADGSGAIDFAEFLRGIRRYNPAASETEGRTLFRRMDVNEDQTITFGEFRQALLLWPSVHSEALFDCWSRAFGGEHGDPVAAAPSAGQQWKSLFAGSLAGAASQTFTAPLERLKVIVQVSGSKTSITGGMSSLYRDGGMRALWRGNLANITKVAPTSGIKFWAFEEAKRLVAGDSQQPLTLLQKLLCGAAAGAVAMTVVYPMETIKTCLSVAPTGTYSGIRDCFVKLVQRDGARGLYPGYFPALVGILPYAGVDLMVYSALKEEYVRRFPDSPPNPFTLLACGLVSTGLGQFVSYPLGVVRTRLQAQQIPGKPHYTGMMHCFQTTLQASGFVGLYRGLTANYLKMVPAASIFYLTFETTLRSL